MANPEHVKILKQGVEVWNKWREENDDVKPDLSNADLRLMNLYGANLSEVNLSEAQLLGVDLSGANLRMVDLSGAKLRLAVLLNAELAGAKLIQATLKRTILGNVDLSGTIGLDKVIHNGPSTIGIDTIYRSKGQIPEVFLKGAGVPDNFIAFARSFTETAIDYYSCFISYNHANKSFARRLYDTLQARGIRCWLDELQMLPGDGIYEQVDRGIRLWDKVLLCCSEALLTSWWVDSEINKAFKKEQKLMKDRGKKVRALIPLNLDGFLFTDEWENGKKDEVLSRLAADFTGWETDNYKFEVAFEKLVKALRADDGAREEPPEPKL